MSDWSSPSISDPQGSMEPRLRGRGMDPFLPGTVNQGELQWSHGSEAVETPPSVSEECGASARFNGATARRPWKRLRPGTWCIRAPGFNGATARRPWKPRRKSLCRLTCGVSFNGATARRPWKHPRIQGGRRMIKYASMEPRLGGRGNADVLVHAAEGCPASMEPRLGGRGNSFE